MRGRSRRAFADRSADLLYKIPNSVPISARDWLNVDELIEMMWDKLDLVRIYTKPRGKQPDYSSPVVLKRTKCTVEDFCNNIHKVRFTPLSSPADGRTGHLETAEVRNGVWLVGQAHARAEGRRGPCADG